MEQLPTLTGKRVRLRHLVPADATDVFALFGNPEITRLMSLETLRDDVAAHGFIERVEELAHQDLLYQWGIVLEHDRVIGTVTLASIESTHRRAELGFAMHADFRGHGYATEAVTTALNYAFGTMKLHRVEVDVDPTNAPSFKLLERVGFRHEGHSPERWFFRGQWQDTAYYGLFARDWKTD